MRPAAPHHEGGRHEEPQSRPSYHRRRLTADEREYLEAVEYTFGREIRCEAERQIRRRRRRAA